MPDHARLRVFNVKCINNEVTFDYQINKQFKDSFKRSSGLTRWSKKRFEEWLRDNIDSIFSMEDDNNEDRH